MERIALNATEAAKLLGCSRSTVMRLAREQAIPFRKPRGRYLFSRAALEAWLADGGAADLEATPAKRPARRILQPVPSVLRHSRRRSRFASEQVPQPTANAQD